MAKIIVTSRVTKNSPVGNAGNLVKYMGTREGVEKLPMKEETVAATVRQQRLIRQILKADPDAKNYPEYQEYLSAPTKINATEFLDAYIERNADRVNDLQKLVEYMAERPGVEKLGKHGLFSMTDDPIDLDQVAKEVANHPGYIWTHVVSLHREDAERLGYNNAAAWKDLVRRNVTELAAAHKIDLDNLQWYAAFHNTAYHPHIHLLVYAKDAKQGWLSKKGIDELRSAFGNDIFRQEQYKLFTMETELRDRLKEEARERIRKLVEELEQSYAPDADLLDLFQKLIDQLGSYKGRWQYGYLPPEMKETVDAIVHKLAVDDRIAELYNEWIAVNKEKLSLYHEKETPPVALEDNKEFRSIKNEIIRCAVDAMQTPEAQYTSVYHRSSLRIIAVTLAKLISASYDKRRQNCKARSTDDYAPRSSRRKLPTGSKWTSLFRMKAGARPCDGGAKSAPHNQRIREVRVNAFFALFC